MICKNCGAENKEEAKFCVSCGESIDNSVEEVAVDTSVEESTDATSGEYSSESTTGTYSATATTGSYSSTGTTTTASSSDSQWAVADGNNSNGIASMVLGIVSIVFSCFCWGVISIICGVIALILANGEKKKGNNSGFVKAGLICALIGIIIAVLIDVLGIAGCAMGGLSAYTEMMNSL